MEYAPYLTNYETPCLTIHETPCLIIHETPCLIIHETPCLINGGLGGGYSVFAQHDKCSEPSPKRMVIIERL